jgi:hypothetical protein
MTVASSRLRMVVLGHGHTPLSGGGQYHWQYFKYRW